MFVLIFKLLAYYKRLRFEKKAVTYSLLAKKALQLAQESLLTNFKASPGYISFCKRYGLTIRTPTHKAQETNKPIEEQTRVILEHLRSINFITPNFDPDCVLNMDETPFYMDINHTRTIEQIGKKSVDVVNTGHSKTRFTVVVTIAASGKKFYFNFRV
jgi:hypothetical protein